MIEWPNSVDERKITKEIRHYLSGKNNLSMALKLFCRGVEFRLQIAALKTYINTCKRTQTLLVILAHQVVSGTEHYSKLQELIEKVETESQTCAPITCKNVACPDEQKRLFQLWMKNLKHALRKLGLVKDRIQMFTSKIKLADSKEAIKQTPQRAIERLDAILRFASTLQDIINDLNNPKGLMVDLPTIVYPSEL